MLSSNVQRHGNMYPIKAAVCTGLGQLITILAPTSRLSKAVNEIAHATMTGITLKYGNNGFAHAAGLLFFSYCGGLLHASVSNDQELAKSLFYTTLSSMLTGFGFIDRDL